MHMFEIKKIVENPELMDKAVGWFHSKWGIPLDAYKGSMQACLSKENIVPQWYVVVNNGRIIGGLGVIENDFHDRKDLAPNVCAVYVEEEFRCQGIAGEMLHFVCRDMAEKGIPTLYLITDHTSFYEKYGWEFLCMARGDGEPDMTRMYIHTMDKN